MLAELFRRLPISQSLRWQFTLALSAQALLIVAGAFTAVFGLHLASDTTRKLADEHLVHLQQSQDIVQCTVLIERESHHMLAADSPDTLQASYGEVKKQLELLDASALRLGQASNDHSVLALNQKKALFRNAAHSVAQMSENLFASRFAQSESARQKRAFLNLSGELQRQAVSLVDSARELSAKFTRDHQKVMQRLAAMAVRDQWRVLVLLTGSVLLAWLFSRYFLVRHVLVRLQQVSKCLRLAETSLGNPPPVQENNEIDEIICAVERFLEDRHLLVQTQRNLRQNEELLRAIIEAAPVAIIGLDLDGKVHSVWNRAAERMLGWSAREAIGRPLATVPEENQAEFARFREQIRKGMTLDGIEVCRKRRDGTPIDYSIYASPLYDTDGKISGNIAVLVDIAERKQAMDALRQSEARLQDIIDCTSDWIWEVSAQGVYSFCSGRIHKVLGYKPEEVLGRTPFDLMSSEEAGRIGEIFARIAAEKAPIVNLENWNLAKDGRRVCLLTNGVPILDREGELLGYRGADQDITERKQLEDQLQRKNEDLERSNAELEQFAYVASHDLQEPLRKVGSFMELVAERYHDQLDRDGREFVDYAVDGARRMKVMIDDLLVYSRVGTRGQTFAPIDMMKVMQDVLNDLELAIQDNDAVVTIDALPVVTADDTQLQQLFRNLIGNALKYRGPDPPQIRVSAKRREQAWQFGVKDNGIGIEPRFFERIFQIFQRLHPRDQFSGTGIGLSVCKKIVERHGGTIGVESTPGQGSTFSFTIPDFKEAI